MEIGTTNSLQKIEELEKQRILKNVGKTPTERFQMLMQLIRIQNILKKATVIYKH